MINQLLHLLSVNIIISALLAGSLMSVEIIINQ